MFLHNLWLTDETPAELKAKTAKMARKIGIPPPKGGSIIRILDIPPIGDVSKLDVGAMQAHLGPEHSHPRAQEAAPSDDASHPHHRLRHHPRPARSTCCSTTPRSI